MSRDGRDITVVGISYMQVGMPAQRGAISRTSVSQAEVIDPIWLSPLDIDTIAESVKKTGRLLVVDNGWTTCGRSAEIVTPSAERLQGVRDVVVQRMGFAPADLSDDAVPRRPFLSECSDHCRRRHAIWSKVAATGWLPEERKELQEYEVQGSVLMTVTGEQLLTESRLAA